MNKSLRVGLHRLFRRTLIRIKSLKSDPPKDWQLAADEERDFWAHWLWTRGGEWPADFQSRCDPNLPLQDHITAIFDRPLGATVRILDVGAGPLTYLGKQWPGRTVEITAVDPLAETYDQLLAQHGVVPQVRTEKGDAERLTDLFPANTFDLVHARNCIDHGYDPVLAIQQMVKVTKPGGLVYMHHAVNEAEQQQYEGFHQWNLYTQGNEFFISSQTQTINVTQALAGIAEVRNVLYDGGIWMANQLWKHPVSRGRSQ